MRIARALALTGVAARRKCEQLVQRGEVTVNGEVVCDLGRRVDPTRDLLVFRGKRLTFPKPVYYLLNKPLGYVTTASDPHLARDKSVYRLLPPSLGSIGKGKAGQRVFPVGRLDRDSMGLLLFTNDGALAYHLTHPRYGVARGYRVRLDKPLREADQKRLLKGVELDDGWARLDRIEMKGDGKEIELVIQEGRKRQIRRLFAALGYRVTYLLRVSFGPLSLGSLPVGRGRFLTKEEIEALQRSF
jgi:23S rRNA pseudouridine2605 synthase